VRRACAKIVSKRFDGFCGTLHEHFDPSVFEVFYVTANLMPGGRTLSKIPVPDTLHLSAYQKFSRDHFPAWPVLVLQV